MVINLSLTMLRVVLLCFCLLSSWFIQAQKGKDGAYTNNTTGEVINSYTFLIANANAGATSIDVNSSALNGGYFSSNLAPGDLIFIVQHQGATLQGGTFIIPNGPGTADDDTISSYMSPGLGSIQNYNNCGNYEFAEVVSTSGSAGTTINLRCALKFSYTSVDHVQVIRVPRFTDLSINNSITAPAWDGQTGGVVVLEVENDLNIQGSIDVEHLGFRGGTVDNISSPGPNQYAATDPNNGARKGEGVGGYNFDYNYVGGMYGCGAYGNAGGGGTAHNTGGGGGANAATIPWDNGLGVPDPAYAAAWNLETGVAINGVLNSNMSSTTNSGGGGRGGYAWSTSNQNALTVGPNNVAWGGNNRAILGGLGGRPLNYAPNKIFFGGGGGAGDMNDNDGGNGGSSGGIVFLRAYDNVTGTGTIMADGQNGFDSNNSNPPFGGVSGIDGAGGGGAGGTVFIEAVGTISALNVQANGGDGGDQIMTAGTFGNVNVTFGPGAGGGGGYVTSSAAGPAVTITGGINGVTNSPHLTEFPPNGATSGSSGASNNNLSPFGFTIADDTICGGGTATLTINTYGSVPGGTSVLWYSDLGSTIVGIGNSFTTPVLNSNTTYYVGMCPGDNLTEVNVLVSPPILIDQTNQVVNNENCGNADGSIMGITASGGTGTLSYDWNGNGTLGPDTVNLAAGSYTLTVTDQNGCTATAGPINLINAGGPTIDVSNVVIANENCGNADGSITGINVSGGSGTLSFDWNGNTTLGTDTLNIGAGTYTLTVSDQAGCSATAGPFMVNNIGGPSIDASNVVIVDEVCGNGMGSITGITASGGTAPLSYGWNGVGTIGLDTVNLGTGSYTLTVTDAMGCSSTSGPHTVNSTGGPNIDVTNMSISDETCTASNGAITGIVVTGASNPTYDWNGNASTGPDLTGASNGAYTLTVTEGTCSVTAGPFTINDQAAPIIDVSNAMVSDENCGQTDGSITGITVTGTPTLSYDWSGTSTTGPDLTNASVGAYTLTVTDGNMCTSTVGPFTVGSYSGPTIDVTTLTITDESCFGNDGSITGISATGSGTLTYDWNGNSSLGTDITSINGGSYTLTVTDGVGCSATSGPHMVNTNSGPVIDASNMVIADENCGNVDGSITGMTASGGTGNLSYEWNGTASSGIDTIGLASGTYTLTVMDQAGCTTTSGPHVINGVPPVTVGLTGTMTICEGQNTVLTGTGATNYQWIPGGSGGNLTFSPNVTTTYQLVGISGPCTDTAQFTITVNPLPIANITGDTIICEGASTILNASGSFNFLWSTTETNSSITVSPSVDTQYLLVASNACGNDSTSVNVSVNPLPIADAGPDHQILAGSSASLDGSGGSTYVWTPSTGLSCTNCEDPVASPLATTTYYVTVTDDNGCTRSDSVIVEVDDKALLFIPNIFSPNNDGLNDILFVRGGAIQSFTFRIYDRWGTMVFETTDLQTGWDGTYKGEPTVQGVYVYGIKGQYLNGDSIDQNGNITLVR